jgi:hypothetical protein
MFCSELAKACACNSMMLSMYMAPDFERHRDFADLQLALRIELCSRFRWSALCSAVLQCSLRGGVRAVSFLSLHANFRSVGLTPGAEGKAT